MCVDAKDTNEEEVVLVCVYSVCAYVCVLVCACVCLFVDVRICVCVCL